MMRAHDWSDSPLGRPETWPACLGATLSLMLGSRFPMFAAFGPELGFLYNDAYAEILGDKHPAALGRRFRDIWAEIWPDIAPLIDRALAGEPTFSEDMPLLMNRHGYDERTWFTFSYSPLRDEAARVVGMFCACTETTGRVVAETGLREAEARLRALTDHLPGGYVFQIATPRDGTGRRFLTVSQGFERMTGVPAEAVLADPAAAYDLILPEHRARIAEAEAGAIRDLTHFDVEAPMRRPDGRLVHTRIISAPRLVDDQVVWDGLHLDDTARHRAEDRLRESEARLRLATEAAEVGLWDVDVVADTLYWPARVKAMFGISPEVPVSMADYYAGIHPDDREATVAAYAAAADPARRAVYDVEYRTVGKEDGQIRWVAAKGRGLFADGACIRVVGTAIDVTARKQAEAALRDSEEQFRVLSQVLPNFVWATDAQGRATWFNERVYAYTGIVLGHLDAAGWLAIIHPDDRARVAADWQDAVAGRADYQCEYRLRRSDGTYRWFLARAQPVLSNDGTVTRWVGTSTDIDDQKQMMAELVRFNETLEQRVAERTAEHDRVWRNSRDLLVVIGADGIFRSVNPAWEAILGHHPSDVVGRSFLDFLWPEDAEATKAALDAAVAARHLTNFENRYTHRDGTPRWLSWHTSVEGGLVFASGRDVTAEKAQAAALAQAEEALRQSQKLEAVGQLTGGVAHDFNNLLMAVMGSLELVQKRLPYDPRITPLLDNAMQGAQRGSLLTQRMLAFARKQELKVEAVDVPTLVRGMMAFLERTLGPNVEVRMRLPSNLPRVRTDPNQFETALMNLAVNARDAMPGGGVITITARGERVGEGRGLTPGDYVRLTVGDTGEGMDEDTVARAMEPFFTTKGVGKGTGLGLSMVHGLAAQSGGKLDIRSRPGEGTEVELWMPVVTEANLPTGGDGPETPADPARRKLLILAVDDDSLVLTNTAAMLDDLGHEVIVASSGREGLEALKARQDIDLIISDEVMPHMTGSQFAEVVRESRPGMPIIIATGYADLKPRKPGKLNLPRLAKPFSQVELAQAVTDVIAGPPEGERTH